jgi:hypothetical protein
MEYSSTRFKGCRASLRFTLREYRERQAATESVYCFLEWNQPEPQWPKALIQAVTGITAPLNAPK